MISKLIFLKIKGNHNIKKYLQIKFPKLYLILGNIICTNYVPVLMFHWFVSDVEKNTIPKYRDSVWCASIKDFEDEILWLIDKGYKFIGADEFSDWFDGKKRLHRKSVLLTFDDGDRSQTELALPILKKYHIPGLCFLIGKRLNEDNCYMPKSAVEDDLDFINIAEMDSSINNYPAFQFGAHTYNMHYRVNGIRASDIMSEAEICSDFNKMTQFNFKYFAAPYGAYNDCIHSNVEENYQLGFAVHYTDCPYAYKHGDRFAINRIQIDGSMHANDLERFL